MSFPETYRDGIAAWERALDGLNKDLAAHAMARVLDQQVAVLDILAAEPVQDLSSLWC